MSAALIVQSYRVRYGIGVCAWGGAHAPGLTVVGHRVMPFIRYPEQGGRHFLHGDNEGGRQQQRDIGIGHKRIGPNGVPYGRGMLPKDMTAQYMLEVPDIPGGQMGIEPRHFIGTLQENMQIVLPDIKL